MTYTSNIIIDIFNIQMGEEKKKHKCIKCNFDKMFEGSKCLHCGFVPLKEYDTNDSIVHSKFIATC